MSSTTLALAASPTRVRSRTAWRVLAPFVVGDTIKLLAAAGLLPLAWRLVGNRT
jgi:hypothetical protein